MKPGLTHEYRITVKQNGEQIYQFNHVRTEDPQSDLDMAERLKPYFGLKDCVIIHEWVATYDDDGKLLIDENSKDELIAAIKEYREKIRLSSEG